MFGMWSEFFGCWGWCWRDIGWRLGLLWSFLVVSVGVIVGFVVSGQVLVVVDEVGEDEDEDGAAWCPPLRACEYSMVRRVFGIRR